MNPQAALLCFGGVDDTLIAAVTDRVATCRSMDASSICLNCCLSRKMRPRPG